MNLLMDGIMVVLLVLVLISTMTLSARLKILRDSRKDFEVMVRQFDEATRRADSGIKNLQSAASKTGEGLQLQLDQARRLRDDLSSMIESAENLASRIESAVPRGAEAVRASEPLTASPRSKAEQDLLRAMGTKRDGGI